MSLVCSHRSVSELIKRELILLHSLSILAIPRLYRLHVAKGLCELVDPHFALRSQFVSFSQARQAGQ